LLGISARKFAELERLVHGGGERPEFDRVDCHDRHRWPVVVRTFLGQMPRDLRIRAINPGALIGNRAFGGSPWVADWLSSPVRLDSRLPPDLSPGTVARVASAYLDRPEDVDTYSVCDGCGLRLPHHRYPPLGEWRLAAGCRPTDRPLRYDRPESFDR